MNSFRNMDLERLNSATKYPSIPTYHKMLERGRLGEVQVDFGGEDAEISEKVDGAGARLIINDCDEYIIGSRNELLHFKGDLIFNTSCPGLVEALGEHAEALLAKRPVEEGAIRVHYGEAYGGKDLSRNSRQYTQNRRVGFRLFDVAEFSPEMWAEIMAKDVGEVAAWRNNGGLPFIQGEERLRGYGLPVVPLLEDTPPLPSGHAECMAWMTALLPKSRCTVDETGLGAPEGVIIRNRDRTKIAKLRFRELRRTLNAQHKERVVKL